MLVAESDRPKYLVSMAHHRLRRLCDRQLQRQRVREQQPLVDHAPEAEARKLPKAVMRHRKIGEMPLNGPEVRDAGAELTTLLGVFDSEITGTPECAEHPESGQHHMHPERAVQLLIDHGAELARDAEGIQRGWRETAERHHLACLTAHHIKGYRSAVKIQMLHTPQLAIAQVEAAHPISNRYWHRQLLDQRPWTRDRARSEHRPRGGCSLNRTAVNVQIQQTQIAERTVNLGVAELWMRLTPPCELDAAEAPQCSSHRLLEIQGLLRPKTFHLSLR